VSPGVAIGYAHMGGGGSIRGKGRNEPRRKFEQVKRQSRVERRVWGKMTIGL